MNPLPTLLGDDWILARRPPRNPVSADRPYAFLVEPEAGTDGEPIDVATIFLTNRECPFRCLMCDLWKNTLESPVVPGQIPGQIPGQYGQYGQVPCVSGVAFNLGNYNGTLYGGFVWLYINGTQHGVYYPI